MTYGFCYYSIQGAKLRNRHVALFGTLHHKQYSTVRHLIVGMSRVTRGTYVRVLTPEQEGVLMGLARE